MVTRRTPAVGSKGRPRRCAVSANCPDGLRLPSAFPFHGPQSLTYEDSATNPHLEAGHRHGRPGSRDTLLPRRHSHLRRRLGDEPKRQASVQQRSGVRCRANQVFSSADPTDQRSQRRLLQRRCTDILGPRGNNSQRRAHSGSGGPRCAAGCSGCQCRGAFRRQVRLLGGGWGKRLGRGHLQRPGGHDEWNQCVANQ